MNGEDRLRLRSVQGVKWTKYADDVLPAFVADMDFEPPIEVTQALEEMVRLRDYGYRFVDIDALIPTWVNWVRHHHGWEIPEEQCAIFTSSMHALEAVMVTCTQPGDGVVLFSPVYHPFRTAIEGAGRRLVDINLREPDWTIDFEKLKAAIDSRVKVVLFCQPHNPTGHVFSVDEINEFSEIVTANDLVVISDEIWGDLILGGNPHQPLGKVNPALYERTITIGSASKTFNLAGARCSVSHIGHASTREALRILPDHYHGQPSSFGAAAAVAAWTHGEPWLIDIKKQLLRNRDYLYEQIASSDSGVRMHLPEATYLAWIDFSETRIQDNPAKHILKGSKVALEPGEKFGTQSNSFARLNFATTPSILNEIVERVLLAV